MVESEESIERARRCTTGARRPGARANGAGETLLEVADGVRWDSAGVRA